MRKEYSITLRGSQYFFAQNYSATTIRIVANEITVIIENAENFGWQTYRDVYHAYEAQGLSKSVLRSKRHCLRTNNAMQSNEIFNLADEQGISKRILENAKKELGIRAKRINNTWY